MWSGARQDKFTAQPSPFSLQSYSIYSTHIHSSCACSIHSFYYFTLLLLTQCSGVGSADASPVPDPGVQIVAQKLRIIVLYRLAFQKKSSFVSFPPIPLQMPGREANADPKIPFTCLKHW